MANFDDQTLTQIDRYLNEEMSEPEQQDFKQKLNSDKALKAEVLLQGNIVEGIRAQADLRKRLKRIDEENTQETGKIVDIKTSRRSMIIRIVAAACILLIAVVAFLNWDGGRTYTTEELYAANFEVLPAEYKKSAPLSEGFEAYVAGDYEKAISTLDPTAVKNQIYLAICHMELEQYDKAIPFLNKAAKQDIDNLPSALWYRALCEIKLGKLEAAKSSLIELEPNASQKMKEDAASLRKKLK